MMEPAQSTPRSRFASTLGSMGGTPVRRAPGTPLSARKTLDRSTRGPSAFSLSTSNAVGTPNNIFRTSINGDRTRHAFTPRASSTLRQTFSPAPPSSSRSFRASSTAVPASTAKQSSSVPLFNQTIDDPPAHLDGENIIKQIPDDPNRTGSIYADEFLAHTCPPGLDDKGRQQWFCILDLRRLKYAANELFAKKDWKLNIKNFAAEYDKSRNLILLHYGLFEFLTQKEPSEAVLKQWKEKHSIPDLDEDNTPARRTNTGSSKRKADDDLPLVASAANKNKRRQTEPEEPLAKGKRRAVDDSEDDENQPVKMHKPSTPASKTLSAFQKAASSGNASQAPSSKPAASSFLTKPATSTSKSIFDNPKATNAPSPNPFEHLSDASRAGSVNNGDANDESDADSDADDTEDKDASIPSGGVGTPADGREGTPSLFDRVTKDKNGQPVRATFGTTNASDKPKPTNQTWNTGTPIKFANPASNTLGAKGNDEVADEPAPFKPMWTAKKTEEPKPAPTSTAVPANPSTSFSAPVAKPASPEPATKPTSKPTSSPKATPSAPVAPTSNLFGATSTLATSAEAPKTASNIFGSSASSQPTISAPSNIFGQAQINGMKPAPSVPSTNGSVIGTSNPFGAKPTEQSEAPKPSMFGTSMPSTNASVMASSTLFGTKFSEKSEAPKSSLFGAVASQSSDKPAGPLFEAAPPTNNEAPKSLFGGASSSTGAVSKPLFGPPSSDDKPTSTFGSTFASNDEKPKTTSLFGLSSANGTSKPLFGAASTEDKPKTSSDVGTDTISESKPTASNLFGTSAATDSKPKTSFFGTSSTQSSSGLFGNSSAPTSTNLFGGNAVSSDADTDRTKPIFGFGGASSNSGSDKPLFPIGGSTPSTSLFGGEKKPEALTASNLFGNNPSSQPSSNLFGGQGNNIFGGSQSGTSTPGGSSFNFSAGGPINPFSSQGDAGAGGPSLNFGASSSNANGGFPFGASGHPASSAHAAGNIFSFGSSTPGTPPATTVPPTFSFTQATPNGGMQQSNNMFAPQPGLATLGGTSTGTSSPFNFGGASSLATTPAATTPEPTTGGDDNGTALASGGKPTATETATADEDGEEKHKQISLTEGGAGEENEEVVYEVKCKALKEELGPAKGDGGGADKTDKSKSAWSTKGVGPLRILRHRETGLVRLLLRAEPRGNVVLNAIPIKTMPYRTQGKYVIAPFAKDSGNGLDKWMLMVKTPESAKELADKINEVKMEKKGE